MALLMIDAIALWQREGMFSKLDVSVSLRTIVARVRVGLLAGGSWGGGVCHFEWCVIAGWLCCGDA